MTAGGGSSEASLSRWAGFFRVFAWLMLVPIGISTLLVFAAAGPQRGVALILLVSSIGSMLGSFVSAAILRGMANIIRLQKMSNRVPFEGELD
jgi:hypothetical protein